MVGLGIIVFLALTVLSAICIASVGGGAAAHGHGDHGHGHSGHDHGHGGHGHH